MSLVNTRMQSIIARHQLDANTLRAQEYGALDLFATDTLVSNELKEKALGSMGNTVKVPVFDSENVVVGNSRSCTISDNENTSQLYQLVFTTLAVQFTVTPVLEMNNYITTEEDLARKMKKVSIAMADALDVLAVTALSTAKSQVYADTLNYSLVSHALQAPYEARFEMLSDMDAIMRANGYRGDRLHVVGNAGIDATYRKLAQHGLYNDANKQLEYAGKPLHFTNNIANGVGVFGSAYVVKEGSCGLVTRVDREAFRGAKSTNGHEFGIINLPYANIPVGYHYYQGVGSKASIAGAASADMTCVITDHYEFSVDVAFITAYNTDLTTYANPIAKLELMRSGFTNPYAQTVNVAELPA